MPVSARGRCWRAGTRVRTRRSTRAGRSHRRSRGWPRSGLRRSWVVGEHDLPALHAVAGLVVREVRGARKEVIADAGHHPNMEHPAGFNELVLAFLREAAGR